MNIVIAGGSGQVGRMLARHFHALGHSVTVLSRSPRPAPWRVVPWDGIAPGEWTAELEHIDVLINLPGRSVNCRYNAANRHIIRESRVRSTQLLNDVVRSLKRPPRLWVNASTATIYRHALDCAMNEANGELGGNEPDAPDTWNFSIDVARRWEEAFFSSPTLLTRKIAIRSALTLSPDRGGVFDVLLGLVRNGLGGSQGSGNQFVSWIHEADFLRAIDLLIACEDFSGVVNLAAPNPLPNRDFMRELRQAWGIGFGLSNPEWLIEIGTFNSPICFLCSSIVRAGHSCGGSPLGTSDGDMNEQSCQSNARRGSSPIAVSLSSRGKTSLLQCIVCKIEQPSALAGRRFEHLQNLGAPKS